MDWKDVLGKLDLPPGDDVPAEAVEESPARKDTLRIVTDRKGRKGKVATIIEGFTADDEEVAEIAALLKRKLGVGGSSRGGEILIQGDLAQKIKPILIAEGYKIKN